MTTLDVLIKLTEYTKDSIAPSILMRKEPKLTGDVMEAGEQVEEYVNPYVTYGTVPHKNFQPLDFQTPCIVWTFDEMEDNGDYAKGRTVNVRAYVSAYSSEIYAEGKLPDNKAFIDLVNLLEKMYIELAKKRNIKGVGIQSPVSYGIYDGAFYPYAYGWVSFTAEIPRVEYEDDFVDEYLK